MGWPRKFVSFEVFNGLGHPPFQDDGKLNVQPTDQHDAGANNR